MADSVEFSGKQWYEIVEAVNWMRSELERLEHHCEHETTRTCNNPDAECPIAMGEWWSEENKIDFDRVKEILERYI